MTTEQFNALEMAAIMLAFADGEEIECCGHDAPELGWLRADTPRWNWQDFAYRIAKNHEEPIP